MTDVVALAAELLTIDSSTGAESAAVDFVSKWLVARGWNVTLQEVSRGRANVWAFRSGGGVTLSTHLDTVPPYIAPKLESNRLYGRDGLYWCHGRNGFDWCDGQHRSYWRYGCNGYNGRDRRYRCNWLYGCDWFYRRYWCNRFDWRDGQHWRHGRYRRDWYDGWYRRYRCNRFDWCNGRHRRHRSDG